MYKEKDYAYCSHVREDLSNLISGKDNRVLDIGCGEGKTGEMLKKIGKAKEVVGIEIDEEIALRAKEHLDKVICGDVEKLTLLFEDKYFDYIIMGDVIEHLVDPWSALRKVSRFLSSGGYLIASIPNINHWRVIADLIISDKWEYRPAGVLDNTHLRFFTRRTILKMFTECGFKIELIVSVGSTRAIMRLFNLMTFNLLRRFLTVQYIVKAQKNE